MAKTKVEVIVDAGKATPAPPLAPAIAPLGVNVGQVVAKINEVTKEFMGVKVPVKVIVDTATKTFEVEVGSPSVSSLIKKEANVEKGAGKKKRSCCRQHNNGPDHQDHKDEEEKHVCEQRCGCGPAGHRYMHICRDHC